MTFRVTAQIFSARNYWLFRRVGVGIGVAYEPMCPTMALDVIALQPPVGDHCKLHAERSALVVCVKNDT